MTRVYEKLDRPLIGVVAGMEAAGVKVDRAVLAGLSRDYGEEIVRLGGGRSTRMRGHPFNLGSVKQLGRGAVREARLHWREEGQIGQLRDRRRHP